MIQDNDEKLRHGLKRLRQDNTNDGDPLIFKHVKKARTRDVLQTSEDYEVLEEGTN